MKAPALCSTLAPSAGRWSCVSYLHRPAHLPSAGRGGARQVGAVREKLLEQVDRRRLERVRTLLRRAHGLLEVPKTEGPRALASFHIAEAFDAIGRALAGFSAEPTEGAETQQASEREEAIH